MEILAEKQITQHNINMLNLAASLGELLLKKQWLLATAESCTGGGLSHILTAIPGSSRWFERGFITYSNLSKIELLHISPELIQRVGAVSEETAIAMAKGVLEKSPTHCSIAITGIAGPDGGTMEKPVGTVWIAWGFSEKVTASSYFFSGDRLAIREQAIQQALMGMLDRL